MGRRQKKNLVWSAGINTGEVQKKRGFRQGKGERKGRGRAVVGLNEKGKSRSKNGREETQRGGELDELKADRVGVHECKGSRKETSKGNGTQ